MANAHFNKLRDVDLPADSGNWMHERAPVNQPGIRAGGGRLSND